MNADYHREGTLLSGLLPVVRATGADIPT